MNINTQNRTVELAEKRQRMQQYMAQQGLDALLISQHENISWATAGLVDLRIAIPRETGAGSLLYTSDGKAFYLTTNNEYPRQSAEEFDKLDYQPLVRPWYANDVAASITGAIGSGKLGSDTSMPSTVPVQLAPLRCQLTPTEVDRYRWLGRNCAEAVTTVLQSLRPGVTETQMQTALGEQLMSRDIMPSVYLTAVDDRVRSYRHAVPRGGVLKNFGMLNFCARRWGLCISITRFVHFGPMPTELEEKFRAIFAVNARLQHATRAGKSADQLFTIAHDAYIAEGYPNEETMHHQGGSTGYGEREWVARPGGEELVFDHQAFAWNPSLRGAKAEDTILLGGSQVELLTSTPDLPVVENEIEGITYRSAGVLQG